MDKSVDNFFLWLLIINLQFFAGIFEMSIPEGRSIPLKSELKKVQTDETVHYVQTREMPAVPVAAQTYRSNLWIVRMKQDCAASFKGDAAHARTSPLPGQKLLRTSPAVAAYARYLEECHQQVVEQCPGVEKKRDYCYALNGFSCVATEKEVEMLRSHPNVRSVTKDEKQFIDTATTPGFLGLEDPGRCRKTKGCCCRCCRKRKPKCEYKSLWKRLGGVENAGENIIIGVIDTGVNPDSLSFTDRANNEGIPDASGQVVYGPPPSDWSGTCQSGEDWGQAQCNNKLIGARYYNSSWGGDSAIKTLFGEQEFNSARDADGHGSHTASTAGGNYNVPTGAGGLPTISGMAPRARIAVYKAFWRLNGFEGDIIAAIDDATADGVDVINYSASNGRFLNLLFLTPVSDAFRGAAEAGIFISQSAGNGGPTPKTTGGVEPWSTSVGATTHDRSNPAASALLDREYVGASVNATPLRDVPVVLAESVKKEGASDYEARLLFSGSLDPMKAKGKIIVGDRGESFFLAKSQTVADAGGIGMILLNVPGGAENTSPQAHYVPTVHLVTEFRDAVRAFASRPGARGGISAARVTICNPAPAVADFSGRGPMNDVASFSYFPETPDILKPDLCAPGVDIYAAFAPKGRPTQRDAPAEFLSGTSMSAPHVTGIAALLRQLHPTWSNMAIKSSLMTTAKDALDGDLTDPNVQFAQGAGFIQPNRAADPGLVFDAGADDWNSYYCESDQTPPDVCAALQSQGFPLNSRDYNNPGVFLRSLVPNFPEEISRVTTQHVKRVVTNVTDKTCHYKSKTRSEPGIRILLSPSEFTIAPGAKQEILISVEPTEMVKGAQSLEFGNAPENFNLDNIYNGGAIYLKDEYCHRVRIPVAAAFVRLSAPGFFDLLSDNTTVPVPIVKTAGPFEYLIEGLCPSQVTEGEVFGENFGNVFPLTPATFAFNLSVDPDTTYLEVSLFPEDISPSDAFLNVQIYNWDVNPLRTPLVQLFGSGSFFVPVRGASKDNPFTIYVNSFVLGSEPSTKFKIHVWQLKGQPKGNMRFLSPLPADAPGEYTAQLEIDALQPGQRYLGRVVYPVPFTGENTGYPNTLVRVNTL